MEGPTGMGDSEGLLGSRGEGGPAAGTLGSCWVLLSLHVPYLQVDALQQLVEGLGLEPLALAGAPALAGRGRLLGDDVHVDELEGAHPVVEQPGPGARRWLLDDADDVPFLGQGRWGWRRAQAGGWLGNTPPQGGPRAALPPQGPHPGSALHPSSPQPRAGRGMAHLQLQRVLVVRAGCEVGVDTGPAAEGAGVGWTALLQPQAVPVAAPGAGAGNFAACGGEGGREVRMWPAVGRGAGVLPGPGSPLDSWRLMDGCPSSSISR